MDPAPDEDPEDDGTAEQDLLVVLRLSNRQMGTADERLQIEQFAHELEAAVTLAAVGEYDGDEIGGGEAVLFFCGPDWDRLAGVLMPLLKRSPLCRGGHLVRLVESDYGEMVRRRVPF